MKRSLLFLCMIPLATFTAWAQALQPDPDPQQIDSCGRKSQIGNEGPVSYETFMTSAISLDPLNQNVTLPLHKGYVGAGTSTPVYYILTDTSDCTEAIQNKINYVPKLANLLPTLTGPGPYPLQVVTVDKNGYIHFPASATFNASSRMFVPDPVIGWPPITSIPGSTTAALTQGAPNYSPYITYVNSAGKQVVFNASHVADAFGNAKNFATVDLTHMTATLTMVKGIYDFNFVMYLRMDATNCTIAGFEGGICAPAPEQAPIGGDRFIADGSARQVIIPVLNGVANPMTNADPYERQGLQSAAFGKGDPLNVMGATPGEDEYSPLWDITPVVWTSTAISGGFLQRLHQDDEVRNFVNSGALTDYASIYGPVGPEDADIGILSLGIVSNCPIMLRVNAGVLPYLPSNQDGTAAEIAALTAPAPPAGNQCNGIYNGTFNGTVSVSSGQNCTFSSGAVVNGNINMKGGFLVVNGATINGNVEIQRHSWKRGGAAARLRFRADLRLQCDGERAGAEQPRAGADRQPRYHVDPQSRKRQYDRALGHFPGVRRQHHWRQRADHLQRRPHAGSE